MLFRTAEAATFVANLTSWKGAHVGSQDDFLPTIRTFAFEQLQIAMTNTSNQTASELDHIPTAWLLTGLVVFPFCIYQLLGFLSTVIYNLTAMRISEVCHLNRNLQHVYSPI